MVVDTNDRQVSQRTVEDEVLLDAVQACVLAVGVRRTTMTDVARRAGGSRMTLYRRYADVTSLMQALMTREFTQIIGEVDAAGAPPPSARDGVAAPGRPAAPRAPPQAPPAGGRGRLWGGAGGGGRGGVRAPPPIRERSPARSSWR